MKTITIIENVQAITLEEPPDDNLYLGIVLTTVVVITGKYSSCFLWFLFVFIRFFADTEPNGYFQHNFLMW